MFGQLALATGERQGRNDGKRVWYDPLGCREGCIQLPTVVGMPL